jgi:hypothetical protein
MKEKKPIMIRERPLDWATATITRSDALAKAPLEGNKEAAENLDQHVPNHSKRHAPA